MPHLRWQAGVHLLVNSRPAPGDSAAAVGLQ